MNNMQNDGQVAASVLISPINSYKIRYFLVRKSFIVSIEFFSFLVFIKRG